MRKGVVYVLGILTGIILTILFAICMNFYGKFKSQGLEMFDSPGEYMDFIRFEIVEVYSDGSALAEAFYGGIEVMLLPNESQHFYDGQKIQLNQNQRALQVGTYKYRTYTYPVIRIVDGVQASKQVGNIGDTALVLFDEPGECVTRKNLEVQKVLESGDAIAKEINQISSGHVFTSDLEVLLLARDGKTFYDKQVVKIPQGKCARQIGTYKYKEHYTENRIIPVVEIR